MHLLLLTSPYQSRIRGCSPSSASAGGGSPNHKKIVLFFSLMMSQTGVMAEKLKKAGGNGGLRGSREMGSGGG